MLLVVSDLLIRFFVSQRLTYTKNGGSGENVFLVLHPIVSIFLGSMWAGRSAQTYKNGHFK